jgi:hypothetical protein
MLIIDKLWRVVTIIGLMWGCWLLNFPGIATADSLSPNVYVQRTIHSPDGIGKYYLGREIAKYMGHSGAGWLERTSREVEEKPSQLINALNL